MLFIVYRPKLLCITPVNATLSATPPLTVAISRAAVCVDRPHLWEVRLVYHKKADACVDQAFLIVGFRKFVGSIERQWNIPVPWIHHSHDWQYYFCFGLWAFTSWSWWCVPYAKHLHCILKSLEVVIWIVLQPGQWWRSIQKRYCCEN